jgi:hypothetical protein
MGNQPSASPQTAVDAPQSEQLVLLGEEEQEQFRELLAPIIALYELDRIVRAGTELEALAATLEPEKLELLSRHPFVIRLRAEVNEVQRILADIRDVSRWNLMKDADGVSTFYRNEAGSPVHSLRIQGQVKSSLVNIAALISEADLYPTWLSIVSQAKLLADFSRFKKAVHITANMPWPLSARDMHLYGFGVDMLAEEKIVVVAIRDALPSDPTHEQPVQGNAVRVECKFAGVLLKPIAPGITDMTIISYAISSVAANRRARVCAVVFR